MFAQDSWVLTFLPSLFALVRFRAWPLPLSPPPPTKVRSFWLELTFSPSISILVRFWEKKLIMSTSIFSWTQVDTIEAWQKCLLYGDVHFIESPPKNQKTSKITKKSTICHDFPSSDLLEWPKDGKIKEMQSFFHSKVFKQGSLH